MEQHGGASGLHSQECEGLTILFVWTTTIHLDLEPIVVCCIVSIKHSSFAIFCIHVVIMFCCKPVLLRNKAYFTKIQNMTMLL